MSNQPTPIGRLGCPNCGHDHIRVEFANMGKTLGIDHVDFFCHVCKRFISHTNVSAYIEDQSAVEDNGEGRGVSPDP